MTPERLKEIKSRKASADASVRRLWLVSRAAEDMAELIAEVERLQARVKELESELEEADIAGDGWEI